MNTLTYWTARQAYNLLITLALPGFLLHKVWRSRKAPAYRQRLGERLGLASLRGPFDLWVHAVSVGEAQVAVSLINELQRIQPNRRILVTTTTPTGSDRITKLLGDQVSHCYLPYDHPLIQRQWSRRISASVLAIIETELWPNLIQFNHTQGTKVLLLNARLSQKSAKGYQRCSWLTQGMLKQLDHIAAQNQTSLERFVDLGFNPSKGQITGSVKFDIKPPTDLKHVQNQWQSWFKRPFIWMAASTHEGEERLMLHTLKGVQAQCRDSLLILAPRHPERFDKIAQLLSIEKIAYARFSQLQHSNTRALSNTVFPVSNTASDTEPQPTAMQVLLIDQLGELIYLYSMIDVAVIGGSFIAHGGGHNPLEAALYKKPTITGPYIRDFQHIYRSLETQGASIIAKTSHNLQDALLCWLKHPLKRHEAGLQAFKQLRLNQGALSKQAWLLHQFAEGAAPNRGSAKERLKALIRSR